MAKLELERISGLWILAIGPTLIAGALLVYILLLESALGAFTLRDAAPSGADDPQMPRIALLNSDYTRHVHTLLQPDGRTAEGLDAILQSWHAFLFDPDQTLFVAEVTDVQVEIGVLSTYDVLILPSVSSMSDRQLDEIRFFMERGGSVLATVTPGVYAPDGSFRGWQFAEETFGVGFVEIVEPSSAAGPGRLDGASAGGLDGAAGALGGAAGALGAAAGALGAANLAGAAAAIPEPRSVALRGGTPFSATIPGGARMDVRSDFVAVRVRPNLRWMREGGLPIHANEPRAQPIAYWRDAAPNDGAPEDAEREYGTYDPATSAAAVYGTFGPGRFVYLGFDRAAVAMPGDRLHEGLDTIGALEQRATATAEPIETGAQIADRLFGNIFAYLLRRPSVRIHDWPYPYSAGAAASVVATDQIEHLPLIVDLFEQEHFPATYLARPHEASRFPTLFRTMRATGAVGVLEDLGQQDDGSVGAQSQRLAELRLKMGNVALGTVVAYAPVNGITLRSTTFTALVNAGYRYVIVDSSAGPATPQVMRTPHERLLQLAVTSTDDRNLFLQNANGGEWLALVERHLAQTLAEEGLFHQAVHTHLLGRTEHHDLLR